MSYVADPTSHEAESTAVAIPRAPEAPSTQKSHQAPGPRISLFGVQIDQVDMPAAVERVLQWIAAPTDTCRYVVTPNVDHAVMLAENEPLRQAYQKAAMVLADGKPIVWASRLLGRSLPERVAGSDLVPALLDRFQLETDRLKLGRDSLSNSGQHAGDYSNEATNEPRLRVYLLGAMPGVADRAAAQIQARWPSVEVVGTYSPPLGFEKNGAECDAIIDRINRSEPDVLLLGLGAPKQELWVAQNSQRLVPCVALCVGATIDFLAGEKPRAPRWMRSVGLEWLHRLASEPRRLARRYLRDAVIFPRLVWREWKLGHAHHA